MRTKDVSWVRITVRKSMQEDLLVENSVQVMNNRRWVDTETSYALRFVDRHTIDKLHDQQTLRGLVNLRSGAERIILEALSDSVGVRSFLLKIKLLGKILLEFSNQPAELEVGEGSLNGLRDDVDRCNIRGGLFRNIWELHFLKNKTQGQNSNRVDKRR
jgi:hypothetical protein